MKDRRARCERLRGGDDSIGVDAVVPVEIRDRPGLAEMLDTERPDLWPYTAPSHASVAGCPSRTLTMPQCGGRPANKRSTWERAWIRPRSRARQASAVFLFAAGGERRLQAARIEVRKSSRSRVRAVEAFFVLWGYSTF
jgi:hypothetical protein